MNLIEIIFYVVIYLIAGGVPLAIACGYCDLADEPYLNTPAKRLIFWLCWGIIALILPLIIIPFVLIKIIKDGL